MNTSFYFLIFQMSFEAVTLEADQEFSLKQDTNARIDYPIKASKFSNITHVSLHFPTNFGDQKTRIYYIGLRGEYIADIRQQVEYETSIFILYSYKQILT